MFSADLSWGDPDVEKVGARRERKAKEKEKERSTPASTPKKGPPSTKSSIFSTDRETWWPLNLRKAKSKIVKPNKHAQLDSVPDLTASRTVSSSGSKPFGLNLPVDPKLHPEWTFSSTFRSTLPSGAPLDSPGCEPPDLHNVLGRSRANSGASHSFYKVESVGREGLSNIPLAEHHMEVKSRERLRFMDEVDQVQQLNHKTFISHTTTRSSETAEPELIDRATLSPIDSLKANYSVEITGRLEMGQLSLDDGPEEDATLHDEDSWPLPSGPGHPDPWKVSPKLEVARSPSTEEHIDEKKLPSLPGEVSGNDSPNIQFSRFSQFIRQMESVGPKMLIERLKGEWQGSDDVVDEEWKLEKQLWLLTAFQLHSYRTSGVPRPISPSLYTKGKILELYGHVAEVYQIAAMHPGQKIHYLSTSCEHPAPLPANVTFLAVPQAGSIPLPYPAASFSHIRASTLPSLVQSSQLPQILRECHRLLEPGGMLEIRIMDASPVRRTAGPKMRSWVEDRVSLNLERLFRCSKPCLLVPNWVSDAGFELRGRFPSARGHMMQMPCAVANDGCHPDDELPMLVGRALWKDIWGSFVSDEPGETRWWWEDDAVIQECLEHQTVFECGALYAYKR